MMKNKIYLAGLLHDIGKFWQRADVYKKGEGWQQLDKNNFTESTFCKEYNGAYYYKHVLWTAQFIEKVLKINERIKKSEAKETPESLIQLAAKHHAPNSPLQNIIACADHLSSGMDRNSDKLTQDALKENNDIGDWINTPLFSIFEKIGMPLEEYQQRNKFRFPAEILDVEKIMPVKKDSGYEMKAKYEELWPKFEAEVQKLAEKSDNIINNKAFSDTLLYVMQKYTVYVPASTQNYPDVSLFDHSKTVAAFAVCLYDYLNENKQLNDFKYRYASFKNSTDEPFLLFGADLSGIQNYIYNIVSKNAAKNLKGRSFYLHLVTTTVIKKILDELNLYQANVIYNSGGGFFMLLPNTQFVKDNLARMKKEIDKEFVDKFHGELYLASAYVPVSYAHIFDKKLDKVWKNIFEQLGEDKNQRFKHYIEENYTQTFTPFGEAGEIKTDAVTGMPIPDGKGVQTNIGLVDKITKDQIEIGKWLKKTKYWYIFKGEWSKKEKNAFQFLEYTHVLSEKSDIRIDFEGVKQLKINEVENFIDEKVKHSAQGFEFYGGNTYPTDENNNPKPYDRLTKGEYNKLAVVRMDVDNLGYIFKNGFLPADRSLSRYSQLSRNLDLFFKGYLTKIWENNEEYKNHTVIVYAGGDDLFLLGDWQEAMDYARKIRNDFKHYVCQNPFLTLSGGIIITPPKYPILSQAEKCEKAEKTGKSYVWRNSSVAYLDNAGNKLPEVPKQKDAVGLFNTALAWEVEYKMIEDKANELKEKIEKEKLPKALLQKLMTYYEMSGFEKTGKWDNKRLIWLMAYDFGRMKERYKDEKQFLENLMLDGIENTWEREQTRAKNYHSLKLYALAARLAELKIRDKNNCLTF